MLHLSKNNISSSFFAKYRNQEEWEPIDCSDGIISNALPRVSELEEVDLDDIKQVRPGVFEDCTSLTTIIFSKSLHRIDYNAFVGCTALQKIVFPDSLEEIDCWINVSGLSKVTLPNPTSDEIIENLKRGYAMDLYFKGDYRDDYWD